MTSETKNSVACYKIDARRGSLTAQAFAAGLLSFVGHNPTFAARKYGGEVNFLAGKPDSMLVVVQADSLSLVDKMGSESRAEVESIMRVEVLETRKFPEIVFVSYDISTRQISRGHFTVRANGNLALCDEKRRQTIEAEAEIDDEFIYATGEFTLKQSDFNIEKVKAVGGVMKVRDEVKISFEITARV